MKAGALSTLCLFAGLAGPGLCGDGGEAKGEKTLSPYFFVENGDPSVDQVPLKATKVDVAVSGVIAAVRVTQAYENRGSRPINARYVFPASTRAAVHGMRMRIGDHRVVATIKERGQAKAEYQEAVKQGKSAALLEQSRPNVFSMSVGNVLPGDAIEVELDYTELLVPEEGVYQFMYPTVVGPRYSSDPASGAKATDQFVANPYLKEGEAPGTTFEIQVALASGIPLRDLACSSHKVQTQWTGPSNAVVRLDPQESGGGNRDFTLEYRLAGERIASGLLLFKGEDENFFLLMGQPPERVTAADLPPREYIFVVDVSGSMNGFPLDISKQLLKNLIGSLKPTDTFNVVLFAGGSRLMSPRSVPASADNVAEALQVIDRQHGGGGTELRAALDQALRIPRSESVSRSVVLLTDGYISAERDVFELVARNLGQTNLFAFGIGSSVNRHLIECVARAGQGEPFVVTAPQLAPAVAERFRRYIQSPVLTHISVAFDGFDAYDVEPAGFPDLLAERPLIAFGKWRGEAAGSVVVSGIGGSGPYRQVLDVSHAAPMPVNRALRHLWARSRVAALSDYGVNGAPDAHRDEVLALGLKYNLLTAYTSFVAVYEVIRNLEGAGTDVKQPLPLPEGVSNFAVGDASMTQGSEPGLLFGLIAAGLLVLGRVLRVRSARVCPSGALQ